MTARAERVLREAALCAKAPAGPSFAVADKFKLGRTDKWSTWGILVTTEIPETKPASEIAAGSFLENLYGDPLQAETMRTGRHLIIASAICISVVLFNVRLQSTSMLPFDIGDHSEVLSMLAALAVLLLFVSFVVRAITDVLHDREATVHVTRYIEQERVKAAKEAARAIEDDRYISVEDDYDGPERDDEAHWDRVHKIEEEANSAVSKAEARVGIRKMPRAVRLIRKCLEIGFPVIFAIVALILSRSNLLAFAYSLFSALRP